MLVRTALVATILLLLASLSPQEVAAQTPTTPQVGRFQIVPIPKAKNEIGATALILDTATGELWYWFSAPALGGSKGGNGIIYQGRAIPASEPGQVVARYGFGEKPLQISK